VPDALERLREQLQVSRRRGVPFERAWRTALNGQASVVTEEWLDVLAETRTAWQLAYERRSARPSLALAYSELRELRDRREELEPIPGPPPPNGLTVRRNGDGSGRGRRPPAYGRALSQRR
jgi:hypothetical protein